jgi:threonine/homoserine/homoserine lactone efflux protein
MNLEFLALLIFLFPLAYSPGPGNMLFAANGARFGFRSTITATTGYHIATVVVTFALGVGFAKAVAMVPNVLKAIQVIGSLYVMWLAWKLWRAGRVDNADAKPIGFWAGGILLLLNPKAYVIIALMFSQFLDGGSDVVDVATVSVVFTLNNLVAFTLWTLVGDALARLFRDETNARHLNLFFGVVLGLVGFWMLFS